MRIGESKIIAKDIEINPQFKRALDLMENTEENIFITGRAGTGKSTLLELFRESTEKNVVVLAPTGVAALNVRGQTIHSFFKFKPDITLDKVNKIYSRKDPENIYSKLDTIVIDEISMVRADLLDCIDRFMRLNGQTGKKPFGGVQVIFIGDLYQLPPVVKGKVRAIFKEIYRSPYFFDSKIFGELNLKFIELEKIYRQTDPVFIEILNAVRNRSITDEQLELLNSRVISDFEPDPDDMYVFLTSRNKLAEEINIKNLNKIRGKTYTYIADIEGDFDEEYMPTKKILNFKIGSQVMLLNNDGYGRWVNGSIGRIRGVETNEEGEDIVYVELLDGGVVEVKRFKWEIFHFYYDPELKSLQSQVIGSFVQYPFMLAWAITIHKSQGKTFDKVIIDIGKGTFAHGQMYVALSRCTSLKGMVLKKSIEKKHIFMDWKIVKFLTEYQYGISEKKLSLEEKIKIIEEVIRNKKSIEIVYLKSNDEKSRRIVKPDFVGEMEFHGKKFTAMTGFDSKRKEERTFRVDRIIEIVGIDE